MSEFSWSNKEVAADEVSVRADSCASIHARSDRDRAPVALTGATARREIMYAPGSGTMPLARGCRSAWYACVYLGSPVAT